MLISTHLAANMTSSFLQVVRTKLHSLFRFSNDYAPFDPSIDKFERYWYESFMVSGTFDDLVNGRQNVNRSRVFKIIFFVNGVHVFRSFACIYSKWNKLEQLSDYLGNYFYVIGVANYFLYFCTALYAIIVMLNMRVVYRSELDRKLDIITDFRNTTVRNSNFLSRLTPKNFRVFKQKTKILNLIFKTFEVVIGVSMQVLSFSVIYLACNKKQIDNLWIPAGYLSSYLILHVWIYFAVKGYMLMLCYLYLSATYITMCFNQLNAKFEMIYSAASSSKKIDVKLLTKTLFDYHLLVIFFQRHHGITKCTMFGLHYISPTIVAVAVTICLYGHFEDEIIKWLIQIMCVQLLAVIVFFVGIASGVHTKVIFRNLNSY